MAYCIDENVADGDDGDGAAEEANVTEDEVEFDGVSEANVTNVTEDDVSDGPCVSKTNPETGCDSLVPYVPVKRRKQTSKGVAKKRPSYKSMWISSKAQCEALKGDMLSIVGKRLTVHAMKQKIRARCARKNTSQ